MMIFILKKFVEDGDVVLDPMCGIGTTMVEGMRLFPNSLFIGVDLEQKFVDMAQANVKKVEAMAKKDMFLKIGKAVAVQGDARELEKVLKEKVGKIISSPPYAERYAYKDPEAKQKDDPYASKRDRIHKPYSQNPNNIGNLTYGAADKIISSPPFQQAGTDTEKRMKKRLDKVFKGRSYVPTQKYPDEENISNVKKYGKIDKIISSPPFGQAQSGGGIAKKGYDGPKHGPTDLVGKRSYMPENIGDKDNISNLPYGKTDKIISSPPFDGQVQHKTNYLGKQKKESGFEYSDNPENIGNLKHGQINKIISSPPYEATVSDDKEGPGAGANEKKYGRWKKGTARKHSYQQDEPCKEVGGSGKTGNIGNLRGQTYLSEMMKTYQQCFRVLKPGGLMILILKDFIRGGKRIHLGEDTVKLCQAAGFKYLKTYHRKIEHLSFWRTLQIQKYGEAYRIDCEDILIFRREK